MRFCIITVFLICLIYNLFMGDKLDFWGLMICLNLTGVMWSIEDLGKQKGDKL